MTPFFRQAAIARRNWSASSGVKPAADDDEPHRLLLKKRDAQRAAQHLLHLLLQFPFGYSTSSCPIRRRR